MNTTLLYLKDFTRLNAEARILDIYEENQQTVLILDQTIFYPQGGGQPYDQGVIESPSASFVVEEVRFLDGVVKHIGKLEHGTFAIGDEVECAVDNERRSLHARIHSAGHLIDKAVQELGLGWKPGKGYHFPNGPYDEYEGDLEGIEKEKVREDLERLCNSYIVKGGKTDIFFMTREQMMETCHYTPDYPMEKGELARVVVHDGYSMPCGGTPVADLSEIEHMTIRKIKREAKKIRISYNVDDGSANE